MKKKVLITSALPYANGPLHFGHIAGAYLPADVFARFERLQESDVLYICGSDEYGVAIALSAELAKRTPKEHVDFFHEELKHFFQQLHIRFDHYARTTCSQHVPLVQQFFLDLLENGYIEERESDQLYSERDNRFLADRYVVGSCPRCQFEEARGDECQKCGASYEATDLINPRSKLTGAALSLRKTRHYFLLFDKLKDKLKSFFSARLWKSNVARFAESYMADIRPRAITRDLEWGVPLPLENAQGKVFYVWFDAPIGYISASQEWAESVGKPDAWQEYWLDPKTKYVQFMGKDNIPFHALFFPAMIMGQNRGYKLVDDLVANEFYHFEGKKFSKSEGWTIDLKDFFRHFSADQIRYVIASNAPETGDSEFSWKDFQNRCNSDLLGKFGNLANRVLVFARNHCSASIPQKGVLEEADHRFLNEMHRICLEIEEAYSSYRLRKSCQLVMELAQLGNSYFDSKAPWKDAKDPAMRPIMQTTIALCLECLKNLSLIAFPITPESSQKLWEMLGFSGPLEKQSWKEVIETAIPTGQLLAKPALLFLKIEDEIIEREMDKLAKAHEKAEQKMEPPFEPIKEEITIDDFAKIDLRVGLIVEAEKLPKSKKLLKLKIDIGLETRTVLSGISLNYTPEELVGKKVVVVANLKPATLMGHESCGMVLAASLDRAVELAAIQNLPAGAVVS